ncbi:MAG TPA: DUF3570 domain-containing protein [Candidatus Polarisedimenticolaceae bacterium]|nr:DUF3570 domain-containing protein [Candidatus Polarisedimenticolaceae bacterium]
MAVTRRRRQQALRRSRLPLVLAGVGGLAAGSARAQSSLEFRYLLYQESNNRTEVSNPWIFLNHDFGQKGGQLSLLLGYDTISGASPTGAYPTTDTTTSASGSHTSSSFPMAEYHDTRKSVTASYGRKFGANLPSVDLSYSKENDYTARGAGLSDAWTMAKGRGTLHAGIAFSRDIVTPVTTRVDHPKSSDSYALGWSWILGERDLFDVSASLARLSGYLDDPYKVVPVGSPTTTVPEHRPDARSRYAAIFKYGHFFVDANGALKVSYRYYWDDWAIGAHTVELLYDQRFGSRWTVSPLVRLYTQSHASFFGYEFAVAQTYMSADYRLSAFDSVLGGLTIAYAIRPNLVLSVGATYQSQHGRDRITPLSAVPPSDDGGGGPGTASAADMNVTTGTIGLTWRY